MGRQQSNLDLLTRQGQETLGVIRKFINNFTSDGTRSAEENISVLGWRVLSEGGAWSLILSVLRTTLGTVFLLILILDTFNYHGGKWTSRLCKLNILVIGASLVSVKYKASEADNCNNTTQQNNKSVHTWHCACRTHHGDRCDRLLGVQSQVFLQPSHQQSQGHPGTLCGRPGHDLRGGSPQHSHQEQCLISHLQYHQVTLSPFLSSSQL